MLRLAIPFLALFAVQAAERPLDSLKPHKVKVEPATYKGRTSVRVTDSVQDQAGANEDRIAIFSGTKFTNGVIEAEMSGEPAATAGPGARGFVAIVFRLADDASKFECFYLRPTNGRADD